MKKIAVLPALLTLGNGICGLAAIAFASKIYPEYPAAGDEVKAADYFRRVAESKSEHTFWPIQYVRSFYFLGKIHEKRGEMEKSREYYRRFVGFWKDGDMDRERVEEAKRKI